MWLCSEDLSRVVGMGRWYMRWWVPGDGGRCGLCGKWIVVYDEGKYGSGL